MAPRFPKPRPLLLLLLVINLSESAPSPVSILEGYSSISKTSRAEARLLHEVDQKNEQGENKLKIPEKSVMAVENVLSDVQNFEGDSGYTVPETTTPEARVQDVVVEQEESTHLSAGHRYEEIELPVETTMIPTAEPNTVSSDIPESFTESFKSEVSDYELIDKPSKPEISEESVKGIVGESTMPEVSVEGIATESSNPEISTESSSRESSKPEVTEDSMKGTTVEADKMLQSMQIGALNIGGTTSSASDSSEKIELTTVNAPFLDSTEIVGIKSGPVTETSFNKEESATETDILTSTTLPEYEADTTTSVYISSSKKTSRELKDDSQVFMNSPAEDRSDLEVVEKLSQEKSATIIADTISSDSNISHDTVTTTESAMKQDSAVTEQFLMQKTVSHVNEQIPAFLDNPSLKPMKKGIIVEPKITLNAKTNEQSTHPMMTNIPAGNIPSPVSNIDLSKVDLSGVDLSNIDVSSVDTSNIDLSALDLPQILSDLSSGNLDVGRLISQVSPNLKVHHPPNFPRHSLRGFGPHFNYDQANVSFPQPPPFLQNFKPVKFVPVQPVVQTYPQLMNPGSAYPKSSYKLTPVHSQGAHFIAPGARDSSFDYRDYDYPVAKPFPTYDVVQPDPYHGRPPRVTVKIPPPDKLRYFSTNNYPHKLQNRFVVDPNFNKPVVNHPSGDEKYITAESISPYSGFNVQQLRRPVPPFRNNLSPPMNYNNQFTSQIQTTTTSTSTTTTTVPPPVKLENLDLKSIIPGLDLGSIDLSKLDYSKLPENFSLANIDLAKISNDMKTGKVNLSSIAGDLGSIDLSQLDLSQIPENFSLADLDLANITVNSSNGNVNLLELAESFGIDSSNLSQIDLSTLDLSQLLGQFAPSGDFDYGSYYDDYGDYPGFEIGEYEDPTGADYDFQGSRPVTENEADKKLVEELGISQLVKMAGSFSFKSSSNMDFMICTMCKTGIVMGRKLMFDMKKTDREIKSLVIHICVEFGMFPADVCRGMLNVVGKEVLHVLRTTPHSPATFCGLMLSNQCKREALPAWGASAFGTQVGRARREPLTPPSIGGSYKILHISDLHLDLEYQEGSDSQCDRPLCCRDWSQEDRKEPMKESSIDKMISRIFANADDPNFDLKNQGSSPARNWGKAGKWGAFGQCDLPLRTIDSILEAAATHKPDLVYITGDLPAHDVWHQTRASVLRTIRVVSERVRNSFPETQVVMTVGNHETVPINSFPVPEVYSSGFNPSWLYGSLAREWANWVPEEQLPSLLKGGYYSVSPTPGLRVLSVNSNYCNSMNWWLLLSHADPTSQLHWLHQQLSLAERSGEKVHIVTHIPPGNRDCEQNWSREFAGIVARFADTVTGIFAGHQHLDQFQVIHDPHPGGAAPPPAAGGALPPRPVGVVYIAPSATTFREHSPSFRLYAVDGAGRAPTWTVVDHETYTMNLTLANEVGNMPVFERKYSAKETFNLTNLAPSQWNDLVESMVDNDALFHQHLRFKHNYWSEPQEVTDCKADCKKRCLCYLVTGDSSNSEPCRRVKRLVNNRPKMSRSGSMY